MKLLAEIKSHGKSAQVYGKPGDKIELVSEEDRPRLKYPNQVVVVRHVGVKPLKSVPFPVIVKDILQ